MRDTHRAAFYSVANICNCQIGVREPNEYADKWIGISGYIPKMKECKAKTSDEPSYKFSGLIVDPILCPEAFTDASRSSANEKWYDFTKDGNLPSNFTRETSGDERGLVKYKGAAIHSDYDLMFIRSLDNTRPAKYNDFSEREPLSIRVQTLLNINLGVSMIQHGAELDWYDNESRVGAAESEMILTFGPNRYYSDFHSKVPKNKTYWH
jgi:hypothetical protein